jgi:hypothetical protein
MGAYTSPRPDNYRFANLIPFPLRHLDHGRASASVLGLMLVVLATAGLSNQSREFNSRPAPSAFDDILLEEL